MESTVQTPATYVQPVNMATKGVGKTWGCMLITAVSVIISAVLLQVIGFATMGWMIQDSSSRSQRTYL